MCVVEADLLDEYEARQLEKDPVEGGQLPDGRHPPPLHGPVAEVSGGNGHHLVEQHLADRLWNLITYLLWLLNVPDVWSF